MDAPSDTAVLVLLLAGGFLIIPAAICVAGLVTRRCTTRRCVQCAHGGPKSDGHTKRSGARCCLLRERVSSFLYIETAAGAMLDLIQGVLSCLSVGIFIYQTYLDPAQPIPAWMPVVELTLTLYFLLDFLLILSLARHPMAVYLSVTGIVDLLTILPPLAARILAVMRPSSDGSHTIVTQATRALRVFRALRVLRIARLAPSYALERQIFLLLLAVISFVFATAGLILAFEDDASLPFHQAMYYATSTVVGRPGQPISEDASFIALSVVILVSASVLPTIIAQVVKLWFQTSDRTSFSPSANDGRGHIIITGAVSSEPRLAVILDQFFHSDRDPAKVPAMVVLGPAPLKGRLRTLLDSFRFGGAVTYVRGLPRSESDLGRAGIRSAKACVYLSAAPSTVADDTSADADGLAAALIIKSAAPSTTLIAQTRRPHGRAHMGSVPGWSRSDMAVSLSDLEMRMLAAGAVLPGVSTLVANLVHMGGAGRAQRQANAWGSVARSLTALAQTVSTQAGTDDEKEISGAAAAPGQWGLPRAWWQRIGPASPKHDAGPAAKTRWRCCTARRPAFAEYAAGFEQEMRRFRAPRGLSDRPFAAAARKAYLKYGVMLIAARVRSETGARLQEVRLFPASTMVVSGWVLYCVCLDQECLDAMIMGESEVKAADEADELVDATVRWPHVAATPEDTAFPLEVAAPLKLPGLGWASWCCGRACRPSSAAAESAAEELGPRLPVRWDRAAFRRQRAVAAAERESARAGAASAAQAQSPGGRRGSLPGDRRHRSAGSTGAVLHAASAGHAGAGRAGGDALAPIRVPSPPPGSPPMGSSPVQPGAEPPSRVAGGATLHEAPVRVPSAGPGGPGHREPGPGLGPSASVLQGEEDADEAGASASAVIQPVATGGATAGGAAGAAPRGHILICGSHEGIGLLARSVSSGPSPLPVVVLCPRGAMPSSEEMDQVHRSSSEGMEGVTVLQGDPTTAADLIRAGARTARAAIVLAPRQERGTLASDPALADGTEDEAGLRDDVWGIAAASALYEVNPSLHVVTQLHAGTDARYLRPNGAGLRAAQTAAVGEALGGTAAPRPDVAAPPMITRGMSEGTGHSLRPAPGSVASAGDSEDEDEDEDTVEGVRLIVDATLAAAAGEISGSDDDSFASDNEHGQYDSDSDEGGPGTPDGGGAQAGPLDGLRRRAGPREGHAGGSSRAAAVGAAAVAVQGSPRRLIRPQSMMIQRRESRRQQLTQRAAAAPVGHTPAVPAHRAAMTATVDIARGAAGEPAAETTPADGTAGMWGAPAFAAGRSFSSTSLDALTMESLFTPHAVTLASLMVAAVRHGSLVCKRAARLLDELDPVPTPLAATACGSPPEAPGRSPQVPPGFLPITFGQLFEAALRERELLCIGLYRRVAPWTVWRARHRVWRDSDEAQGFCFRPWQLQFVYTNPSADTLLGADDLVYVLCL